METFNKLKDNIVGSSNTGNQDTTGPNTGAEIAQQFQGSSDSDSFKPDIENATNREITPDVMAVAGGASTPIQPDTHVFTPPSTEGADLGGDASAVPSALTPDGGDIGQELGSRQTAGPVGGHSAQEAAVAGGAGLNELGQE